MVDSRVVFWRLLVLGEFVTRIKDGIGRVGAKRLRCKLDGESLPQQLVELVPAFLVLYKIFPNLGA